MKFALSQLAYFVGERQFRRNLGALLKYLLFVIGVISVYSVLFHIIMLHAEGQRHSWLTAFYWTLTVMSTLGFGDITFHTDIGRLFSIAVLLSGVVLLLIMLPFAFIRYFYAPWLEAQIHLHVPRAVPEETSGHVIICRYDSICPGLIEKLQFDRVPYFVLEPDPGKAAQMISDEISVIAGEIDSGVTYERLRVTDARMVIANAEDTVNSNVTLTVREVSRDVSVVALAEDEDSIDILELSGATQVLPLKRKLGEHLAARTKAGASVANVVGAFKDLQIAEFVAHDTDLAGKTLKETRLRELTGVSVVGVWEQGSLQPARSELRFSDLAVPVVIGSREQINRLNALLIGGDSRERPVLVIGGGKVGQAVASALRCRGAPVHMIEKKEGLREMVGTEVRFVKGDAADRDVLRQAGLEEASAVVLTTNDDAVNIYLTVYCRRLRPKLNIVSRITHDKNIESIYRAGADSVLSYSSLGREYVISLLLGREPILLGAAVDFFLAPVPKVLSGKPLGESQIGSRTGLIVIAVEDGDRTLSAPPPSLPLPANGRLLMVGTAEQRRAFSAAFD
jgi:Trk K+ transport system NAD-binding subunit